MLDSRTGHGKSPGGRFSSQRVRMKDRDFLFDPVFNLRQQNTQEETVGRKLMMCVLAVWMSKVRVQR